MNADRPASIPHKHSLRTMAKGHIIHWKLWSRNGHPTHLKVLHIPGYKTPEKLSSTFGHQRTYENTVTLLKTRSQGPSKDVHQHREGCRLRRHITRLSPLNLIRVSDHLLRSRK